MAVLLTLGACGPSVSTPSASQPPSTTAFTPSSTETLPPSPEDTPEYPNLSKFVDPLDQFAYKSAYSDCRLIGVDGTADAFGGDPDDPGSVARAYAVAVFPERREAPFRGCLDAFETETDA